MVRDKEEARGYRGMNTTVVCGLLGAGKTTFIEGMVGSASGRTVVLVNDFGSAGIDGEILAANDIESIELPSGCVCCTLKFDLITTIKRVVETYAPERLVIEPSGVASPSGVLEALETLEIRPVTVIGIVDAVEFVELYESEMYGSFFMDQVCNSDVILVNKADLAAEAALSKTISLVESLNPSAVVLPAVRARVPGPLPAIEHSRPVTFEHREHFRFETVSYRVCQGASLGAVLDLFERLRSGSFGDVVRAKALIQTDKGPYRFDLASGRTDHAPFVKTIAEGRLVVIGEGLRRNALGQALPF